MKRLDKTCTQDLPAIAGKKTQFSAQTKCPLRASKENAENALDALKAFEWHDSNPKQRQRWEFIRDFLIAAKAKLPREASFVKKAKVANG
jgi:hypothetical protein